MSDDFATDPEALDVDFWVTIMGDYTMKVITALDKGELPDVAIQSITEVLQLHTSGDKIQELGQFNASDQAVKLANILTKTINHYMPGGMIDDSRAGPSDIKNIMTSAATILKLINQIQGDLYTHDRHAAMERAIRTTFDNMTKDVKGIDESTADALKIYFRTNLEMAFSSL